MQRAYIDHILKVLEIGKGSTVSLSYKKSQRDALFHKFILVKNSTCFGTALISIIRSLNTVYTATGICHTSYAERLLARSGS